MILQASVRSAFVPIKAVQCANRLVAQRVLGPNSGDNSQRLGQNPRDFRALQVPRGYSQMKGT